MDIDGYNAKGYTNVKGNAKGNTNANANCFSVANCDDEYGAWPACAVAAAAAAGCVNKTGIKKAVNNSPTGSPSGSPPRQRLQLAQCQANEASRLAASAAFVAGQELI